MKSVHRKIAHNINFQFVVKVWSKERYCGPVEGRSAVVLRGSATLMVEIHTIFHSEFSLYITVGLLLIALLNPNSFSFPLYLAYTHHCMCVCQTKITLFYTCLRKFQYTVTLKHNFIWIENSLPFQFTWLDLISLQNIYELYIYRCGFTCIHIYLFSCVASVFCCIECWWSCSTFREIMYVMVLVVFIHYLNKRKGKSSFLFGVQYKRYLVLLQTQRLPAVNAMILANLIISITKP